MTLYFLEYDLRSHREYERLYGELDRFRAVRVLESCWCFNRYNTSPAQLRDYFKQFIDADDGLAVSEVSGWATFNANGTPNDLKQTAT